MAKLSAINKNNRRIKLSDKFYQKRKKLKQIVMNKKLSFEEGLVKECLSKGSGHVLENILLFALFHFSHINFILFYC